MDRMTNRLILAAALLTLGGCATLDDIPLSDAKFRVDRSLRAFTSFDQAKAYADRVERIRQMGADVRRSRSRGGLEEVVVSGLRASIGPSITNNQEAGVDEGDIVKFTGRYLVILRQGRLYSVDLDHDGAGRLKKVDRIDVSPPTWPHDAWYDELLVHGNTLVVIGYSYELGASELVFFELGNDGKFAYSKTYLIESTDYYDSENYAGRLVDGKLVLSLENYLDAKTFDSVYNPRVMLVDRNGEKLDLYPLFGSHAVFSPVQHSAYPQIYTAAVCPLDAERLSCSARSIIADHIETHYVSPDALYMWGTSPGWAADIMQTPMSVIRRAFEDDRYDSLGEEEVSVIYRLPLAGPEVTAVEVYGRPLNQFSFSERHGNLYIAGEGQELPSDNGENAYWARIPLNMFSNAILKLPADNVHIIPFYADGWRENRYVNDHLVYTSNERRDSSSKIYIADITGSSPDTLLESDFGVSDIQPIGDHALLIGSREGETAETVYTSISLSAAPSIAGTISTPESELAETRSHGFNYRPLEDGGMFGIPLHISFLEEKEVDGVYYDALPAVDMQYFGLTADLSFYDMGTLSGDREIQWQNYGDCNISCYDWYGSSRPFFIGERIFALLKNELVEGYLSSHSIHEKQRIDVFD
ncbi:MAG TPA: beta-propeller domain-containing protein [Gammaproteobacteria bacterium]